MQATAQRNGAVTVVELAREYGPGDFAKLRQLRALFERLTEREEPPRLLVDLGGTHYLGAGVIAEFARCRRRVRERGGQFALCSANPFILEVLTVTGLDSWCDIHPTRGEALEALETSAAPLLGRIDGAADDGDIS